MSEPTVERVLDIENKNDGPILRFANAVTKYISSPARRSELLAAVTMSLMETAYDLRKVPEEYSTFSPRQLSQDNVGPMPENPDVVSNLNVLGDVFEISYGHTVVRIGLHTLNQYAGRELLKEEASFWISLAVPVVLKAIHSLGLISIFGIHDHMDDPVPQMLIGQALASAVLIYSHYKARRSELSGDLGVNLDERVEKAADNLAIESGSPDVA